MKYIKMIGGIGEEKFNNLKNKSVAIIGLGGVGGHAAESIARSGINNIIIMDFDIINKSDFNRQLIALDSTLKTKKTEAMKNRIIDIDNTIKIKTIDEKYQPNSKLFDNKIDFLIDAIDDIPSKIDLIKECIKRNIPFITVTGMANKRDPMLIKIVPINKTSYDPISRILRKNFPKEKFMVISSTEQTLKSEKLFTTSFIPSIAGIMAASYVINNIIKEE